MFISCFQSDTHKQSPAACVSLLRYITVDQTSAPVPCVTQCSAQKQWSGNCPYPFAVVQMHAQTVTVGTSHSRSDCFCQLASELFVIWLISCCYFVNKANELCWIMTDEHQELPIEVIELIIKRVPETSIRDSVRFVCKSWHELAKQHLKSRLFLLFNTYTHTFGRLGWLYGVMAVWVRFSRANFDGV